MTTLSRDDCHQLYMGCLVDIGGRLGFVRDTTDDDGSYKLLVKFVGDTRNSTVDPDPDTILCPSGQYRLGYVQLGDTSATYLSRSPRRQYQVGWSENNVSGFSVTSLMRMGTRLVDNLSGKFPSYKEALETSIANGGCVAFDRMFAVDDGGHFLRYKGDTIARIVDGQVDLEAHGKEHLTDLLNKAMGV